MLTFLQRDYMQPFLILFFLLAGTLAQAQNVDDLGEMSLEDLLNVKTSVASKSEKTTRQSPGIITVISKDEIKKMGARDLIDILQTVPGFTFAHDTQGVVGLAVRGSWANEGKYSLMVDGQEMNEILYSSVQFGNHYPVDHINRIEIIRGPGSAIYGGYAELAVIHVITDKGSDINGARATYTYGQMRENYGRKNLSLQFGQKFGDWDVSIAGLMGQGHRSNETYTGYTSNATPPPNYNYETYSYADGKANDLNPNWINVGVNNGKLDFRFIYDDFKTTTRAQYGYSGLPQGLPTDFTSLYASLKYDWKVNDSVTLTPYINYRKQNPWKQMDPMTLTAGAGRFDVAANRSKGGLSADFKLNDILSLLVGIEAYQDAAKANTWEDPTGTPKVFGMTGNNDIKFDGLAAYAQQTVSVDDVDVTVGARWEQLKTPIGNTVSNLVPRLAVTKAAKNWHIKGLVSQAYRIPSILNFDIGYSAGLSIKPETTTTYELETGFAVNNNSYLTFNVFSTNITNPIVYEFTTVDQYSNFPLVSTIGAETDYRIKGSWGFLNFNYSYYQKDKNEVTVYNVPDSKQLLGIPQNKVSVLASWKTGLGNFHINPSVVYLSSKAAYEYNVVSDSQVLTSLPSVVLSNLYLNYPDLFINGFELGVGAFNMFDTQNRYVQPYAGGNSNHFPAPGREYIGRVNYTVNF